MATIYPSYDTIINHKVCPTEGELLIIDFLLDNLSDEYELFYQPYLNGDIPDIVLMRKNGGVLIIEVKDWKLSNYYLDYRKKWFVSHNNALIKSPISQVLKYKENLYDLHIRDLLEYKLSNFKYWYIVSCAIFFTHENNHDIKSFFMSPFQLQKNNLEKSNSSSDAINKLEESKRKYQRFINKNIDIIGKDNLNKSFLYNLLEKNWISKNSYIFKDKLYESFKRYLQPSFHSLEDGKNFKYSPKQTELSTSRHGEQKIKGIVGSGKTLVLAKRAVNAHKETNNNVLILTYNISLKNYIHDKLSDVREDFYWKFFHIINYHDFINSTMNNLGIEFNIPNGFDNWENWRKDKFFNDNYYGNINLFIDHISNVLKYHTILIDEVQDYQTAWLRIIKKYFLVPNGEFVFFGDSKQDIYNRVSLVNNKKELVIPDSPGRWAELNSSFRLTPTITTFASAYQNRFLSDKHIPDVFENSEFQPEFFDKVYYKKFFSVDYHKLASFIISYSRQLDCHPNDVCVLSLSIDIIREIDFQFRKLSHEKSFIMAETKEFHDKLLETHGRSKVFLKNIERIRKNKKLHFWMNSGFTKFSTVHSFKGWEINTLFLIVQKDTFEETYKELVYTGFTRCMNNLIIINIDDNELNEFLSELKYVEEIGS